jgi:predicted transposase/invertase (TIGR01784 family)
MNNQANPYDTYLNNIINEHTKEYIELFLDKRVSEVKQLDSVTKKNIELRADHIFEITLRKRKYILHIESQLEDNKNIINRQLIYYSHINDIRNKNAYPLISYMFIFFPSKSFKRNSININYHQEGSKKQTRKDTIHIEDITNKVKPDELLKYPDFIPLIPAIENKKTDNTRTQLYKKVLDIIESIKDYHKKSFLRRNLAVFFKKRYKNIDLLKELTKAMDMKEFIKEFNLEDIAEEGKKEGIKEGKKEGIKERNKEIAKNLKKKKYNIKEIKEITGLTEEEIKKL